ncbi:acyl-CoA dehydrogenase family protein [Rhodococcus globerulus]|uniref:acyl-CoA dehydrogenase family protein n=1 Tax=Rhodococcus globerulus TaxID=33008 RepID=UPI003017BC18
MNLQESTEQQALRKQLAAYLENLVTEEERLKLADEQVGGDGFRAFAKRLGDDGWLGVGWPVEYGGQGRSLADQYVFFDELQRTGLPFPFVTINTVGPTLMKWGTEEQKQTYLPGMLSGEIVFSIGYTEPEAGTDLASMQTRAMRDGDDWVITGQKVFTTGANTADFVWLACRTDPDAPKHRGISILIVPTADPGFSWTPIELTAGNVTTSTSYDQIRVPAQNLVGEVNQGWKLITTQLNHERIGLAACGGRMISLWERVTEWAHQTGVIHEPWVQRDLARAQAMLQAMALLNWKMTWAVNRGELVGADASAAKVFGTETHVDVQLTLVNVLGAAGRIRPGSPTHRLAGEVEQISRQGIVNTFGGGVNEVLRDMVAASGLGLPRLARGA